MKKLKTTKKSLSKEKQEQENLKILANFFKESTAIMEAAIKESHRKYPKLFNNS